LKNLKKYSSLAIVASDFAMKSRNVIMTGLRPSEMRPKTNYDEAK
jgi:hypothetical protein